MAPTFRDELLAPFLQLAFQANPITFVSQHTPPHFVAHGTIDDTVPYWQSVRLHWALQAAGVEHVFAPALRGWHNTWSNETAWRPVYPTASQWVRRWL